MSAAVMHKRNHSELSQADEQGHLAKAAKVSQVEEPEVIKDAQTEVLQLKQTIELARTSLKSVLDAFQEIPSDKTLEYLRRIASILDGSSEDVSIDEVADARARQRSVNLKKLYTTTVAKIDRVYEKMYHSPGVTADDFAEAMTKFVPVADEMLAYGSEAVVYAFELMMYVAGHVCGDLDRKHASGFGDSEDCYQVMDPKLLQVIDMRVVAEAGQQETMEWKNEALAELVSERDILAQYGIEGYFVGSIKRLQELTNHDGHGNRRGSRSETGSESQSDSESD